MKKKQAKKDMGEHILYELDEDIMNSPDYDPMSHDEYVRKENQK